MTIGREEYNQIYYCYNEQNCIVGSQKKSICIHVYECFLNLYILVSDISKLFPIGKLFLASAKDAKPESCSAWDLISETVFPIALSLYQKGGWAALDVLLATLSLTAHGDRHWPDSIIVQLRSASVECMGRGDEEEEETHNGGCGKEKEANDDNLERERATGNG